MSAVRPLGLDVPLDVRRELLLAPVTLNGKKAKITGYRNEFATVSQVEGGLHYEWSWVTVKYVVLHRKGRFRS